MYTQTMLESCLRREAEWVAGLDCHGSYSDRLTIMMNQDEAEFLDPKHRVQELKLLFRSITSGISQQVQFLKGKLTTEDAADLKAEIAKLESTHLTLAKAEEAFHEKTKDADIDDGPDYEAIRDKIGSALDRIRSNTDPESVSRESDE